MNDPKADFNAIVAEADSFFTNADSVELSMSPISAKHFGYWYHFWRHRLDSNGSTRIDAYSGARDIYYDTNYCTTNSSIPPWSEIGPTSVAQGSSGAKGVGFVNDAWIKPSNHNVMIIGTAGGGIFKTTDGGNSWTDIMSSHRIPGVPVRALEVNPDNENHIYASIGDKGYGLGLIRSTDGGVTWFGTQLTKDPQNNYEGGIPRKIVANKPQYFEEAYAITKDALYQTTNGFLLSPNNTVLLDSVANGEEWVNLARNQSGHVFYSSQTQLKRYTESNNQVDDITSGLNWSQQNATFIKLLVCTDPDRNNHVFVLQEWFDTISIKRHVSFYVSNDNGNSFTFETDHIFNSSLPYDNSLREDFAASIFDDNTFYISGGVRAHRLTKSGGSWSYDQNWSHWTNVNASNYAHADVRDIEVLTAQGGYDEVYWSTDGGLFKSIYNVFDNVTKQDLSIWMVNGFVDFDGTDEIFCGVYHGGNNFRGVNKTWNIIEGADGGAWAVANGDPNKLIGGSNSIFYRYDRNGNDLTGQSVSSTQWWLFVASPLETYWGTEDSFLVAGNDLRVYDWSSNSYVQNLTSSLPTSQIRDVKCHAANNQIIVFANNRSCISDSALFKSTNGGQSWSDISANLNVDAPINTIFMHPSNPNEIWVGVDGFINGQKVFKTTNNGASWTNVSDNLWIYPVNDFAYDAVADILYAATDFGVYYLDKSVSNDHWHCYYKNLPTAYVNQIDVNYCTKKLVAATAGRGFQHVDLWQLSEHTNPTATWSDTTLVSGREFYSPGSIDISGTVTISGSLYI